MELDSRPPAGLRTGEVSRARVPAMSMFEPYEPQHLQSNVTVELPRIAPYQSIDEVPKALKTMDLAGARPRSRPGLGMGNHTLPNGMYTQKCSTRAVNSLFPIYNLPNHGPQGFQQPVPKLSSAEPTMKTAGLDLSDIPGSSPKKSRRGRAGYSSLDYSDVPGPRRYESKFTLRHSTSLTTTDIHGASPMSLTGKGPIRIAGVIEKTSPTKAPHFSLGRHPMPSDPRQSFCMLARDTDPGSEVFVLPRCRRLRPDI